MKTVKSVNRIGFILLVLLATASNLSAKAESGSESAKASTGSGVVGLNDNVGAATGEASPVKKPVLQGGVDHAEVLPGVEAALKPGNIYSDDLLQKGDGVTNNLWFRIPAWYAGTRHVEDCVVMYRYDYKTGKASEPLLKQLNRQSSLSGYLQDKNGGIWDFKSVPEIQHVESDLVNAVIYVKKITPVICSAERMVVKYEELSISIGKEDNKILQVLQQEQINTMTSPVPGTLHIDISVKCFDFDGAPNRLEQSVSTATIVKPFTPQTTFEGKDLRPLFKDYLIAHDLADLVPDTVDNQGSK